MFQSILRNFHWQRTADKTGPRQLAVLEIDNDETRAVILNRFGKSITWNNSQTLPPVKLETEEAGRQLTAICQEFLRETQYVSISLGGAFGLVRLLNFPGDQPNQKEQLVKQTSQMLGVDDSFSVQPTILVKTEAESGKKDYSVLTAAMKNELVDTLQQAVLDKGMTPVSLVPSGIASANLAAEEIAASQPENAIAFVTVTPHCSILFIYNKTRLVVARQFKTGFNSVIESLMETFGLDRKTVYEMMKSGSFDLSENLTSTAKNWMHQISISLDFVERRYGCNIEKLMVHSASENASVLQSMFSNAVNHSIEHWHQFAGLRKIENIDDFSEQIEKFAIPLCEGLRIISREHGNEL